MKRYKLFLLFSATALLLAGGGIASSDEVSQPVTPEPTAVSASADDRTPSAGEVQKDRQAKVVVASDEPSAQQSSEVPASQQESGPASAPTKVDASSGDQTVQQSPAEQEPKQPAAQPEEPRASTSEPVIAEGEGQDTPDMSTEEYEANIADLKQVTMADVYHMFDDREGSYTLYLGRPTCIYCRKFSPVIKEFNKLSGGQVFYYNTDSYDFSPVAKAFLRNKIGVFATPTVFHLEKGQIVSGQLGSGGTAQELYDKVFTAENRGNSSDDQEGTAAAVQEPQTPTETNPEQAQPTEQPQSETTKSFQSPTTQKDDEVTFEQKTKHAQDGKITLDTSKLVRIFNKALSVLDDLLSKFTA